MHRLVIENSMLDSFIYQLRLYLTKIKSKKVSSKTKIRKAFIMQLKPNNQAEYYRRHNPIWAELAAMLKAYGVSNYSIFLDRETDQLFAYAEVESEEQWAAIANTEICRRWWIFMRDLMNTNADNSPTAIHIREVFHLE